MCLWKYIYTLFNILSLKVVAYISICFIILSFLAAKVVKRKKFSARRKSSVVENFSPHEAELSRKFQIHSSMLNRIVRQISNDRQRIEESVYEGGLQEDAADELTLIMPSVQITLYTLIEEKYSSQNKQEEEILGTLKTVEKDFSTLKGHLFDLLCSGGLENQQKKDCESGSISNILSGAKEDLTELISENRCQEKEMLKTIFRFLQESQTDIRKEVVLFSSVVSNTETFSEKTFRLNFEVTLDRMKTLKQNTLSAHIFLNEKYAEMKKLERIVLNFNQKFLHFVDIFDAFFKCSKIAENTCRRLEGTDMNSNSLMKKIDTDLNLLTQQLNNFDRVLADMNSAFTTNKLNLENLSPFISNRLGERPLEFNLSSDNWTNNVDVLNLKLENLLHISETSKEKEESLKRTSNNFEKFHNLMKSMTRSYNDMLRLLLSTLEPPQQFHRISKSKLQQSADSKRNNEVIGNNYSQRRILEKNENCAGNGDVPGNIRSELDLKLKNANKYNIVFILKDIMQAIRKLVDEEQVVPGDINETDIVSSGDYRQWGDFPSESLLTDVSSEFLVHSSDESTGGFSEVILEG